MSRKTRKISEEDFALLSVLKEKNINIEELKELDRLREIKLEDKQHARLETIKINNRRIKAFERLVKYKKDQIKSNVSLEKHEQSFDEKKPIFMLENEIEESEAQIEQFKELNKLTQEEYDKDDRD